MKNLLTLVAACQKDLMQLGITPGQVSSWKINSRAKTRWGLCRRLPDGTYEIQISALLLRDELPDQPAKDTIIHELLHTVPGGNNHTGIWKTLADKVQTAYPQYTVKRTSTFREKGITQMPVIQQRYLLQCTTCHGYIGRQKISKVIRNSEKYRCRCGGKLIRLR